MNDIVLLKRTITFRRMNTRKVKSYQVFAMIQDQSYITGFRMEQLDEIENPIVPDTLIKRQDLQYNRDLTWKLPGDLYYDIDHKFNIYVNGFILSQTKYNYNKVTKLVTINSKLITCEEDDKFEIEYYRDVISRTYMLDDDVKISIVPVFQEKAIYGKHNVIV